MAYGKGKKRKTKPGSKRTGGWLTRLLDVFTPAGPGALPSPMSYPLASRKPNQRQRRKRARWVGARVTR